MMNIATHIGLKPTIENDHKTHKRLTILKLTIENDHQTQEILPNL